MSDRHKLQHGVGITIIYLTLLLSIPASTSASKFKQRTRASLNPAHNEAPTLKRPVASSRVNIPRIYAAYRVLLTEGGGDAKINVGEIGKKIAVVEEAEDEAIQKSVDAFKQSAVTGIQTVIVKNLKEKVKDKKSSKVSLTPSDNAAKVEDIKCARIENVKDVDDKEKEKEKEQLEKDNPTLQGLLVVDMDPSSKSNKLRVKTLETVGKSHEKVAELDSAERRIAELNRVYKEFMNAWKRPTPESRGFSLLGKANKYPPRPINLNALNELMNVVENLQQANPVDDIVKAINDAMNPDLEGPLSSNRPTVNSNNLVPTGQIPVVKRRISSRSSKKFKRVVSNVPADMKTGSLYEEYKKKLNDILQEQDHSHTSLATQVKVPIQAGTVKKLCALTQCHCDEGKPQIMSVDSAGPKLSNNLTPCHCEATRPASSGLEGDTVKITNGLAPCHCADIRGPNMADVINACVLDARTGKTDKHLKDLNTCKQANKDNKLNGGLKPYYLSNSKHRQMVWNDVPLIRPGSPRKTEATKQNVPKNDKVTQTNGREPIVAKSCASKAKSEQNVVNSSLRKNDSHSESTIKRKNQLQHILKVFQSKHRSMNVRKTRKRGLAKFINGIEGTPANLAFPEVLVNKFGQTPETGGKLIENMAKQLNVSPMEMAQHIASSSGQSMGAGTYPMQPNIARPSVANYQWQQQI